MEKIISAACGRKLHNFRLWLVDQNQRSEAEGGMGGGGEESTYRSSAYIGYGIPRSLIRSHSANQCVYQPAGELLLR